MDRYILGRCRVRLADWFGRAVQVGQNSLGTRTVWVGQFGQGRLSRTGWAVLAGQFEQDSLDRTC